MEQMSNKPYYTPETLHLAAGYWDLKDADSVRLDKSRLKEMLEE